MEAEKDKELHKDDAMGYGVCDVMKILGFQMLDVD